MIKDQLILEKLYDQNINYFSFSLFKKGTPLISHCNDIKWLEFYNNEYDKVHLPPVHKYIFCSALKVITWDRCELDKVTNDYIARRNDIVGVSSNITFVFKENDYLTAITLGSKKDSSKIIGFLSQNLELLSIIKKDLFYKDSFSS